MKVENMLKLKVEFDYKSLSRRLDIQLDKLIAENERLQKAFEDELEKITVEAQSRISEAEINYAHALEKERVKYQEEHMESIKKLEQKWEMNQKKYHLVGIKDDCSKVASNGEATLLASWVVSIEEVSEIKKLLQKETLLRKSAEEEVTNLKGGVDGVFQILVNSD